MNWLKGCYVSLKVAAIAFLGVMAVMAAKSQKAKALKWAGKAEDIEQGNVKKGTMTAAAASSKAKLHDNNAHQIKAKAEARVQQMGDKDEEIADILDQFRKS